MEHMSSAMPFMILEAEDWRIFFWTWEVVLKGMSVRLLRVLSEELWQGQNTIAWRAVFLCVMRSIWLERNKCMFECKDNCSESSKWVFSRNFFIFYFFILERSSFHSLLFFFEQCMCLGTQHGQNTHTHTHTHTGRCLHKHVFVCFWGHSMV